MPAGDGPAQRRLGVSADDDGDRTLRGSRVRVDAGEVDEAPVMLRCGVIPEALERIEVLVGEWTAVLVTNTDRGELALLISGADAEPQPSVRQHIERRCLLCEHDRIVVRQHDDARAEQ